MADITEIETDTEEDYWENVSLIVTQDIQNETNDGQNATETTQNNFQQIIQMKWIMTAWIRTST